MEKMVKARMTSWRRFGGPFIAVCLATAAGAAGLVPHIFNPNESQFQKETHFLVFTDGHAAGENAQTAVAYYNAVDPTGSKRTFEEWLVNDSGSCRWTYAVFCSRRIPDLSRPPVSARSQR